VHHSHHRRRRHHKKRSKNNDSANVNPFMLERTDVVACQPDGMLHVFLRVFVYTKTPTLETNNAGNNNSSLVAGVDLDDATLVQVMQEDCKSCLQKLLNWQTSVAHQSDVMQHVATAILQEKLRAILHENDAVAFVANGAILPRKSGASTAPMASPPAIPFVAPTDSPMRQSLTVNMGLLTKFIVGSLPMQSDNEWSACSSNNQNTEVTLEGLIIPRGVSLIVGGGYHGKSTLLRCLAAGVYNKIPGDGREFCVTVNDAVTVRAEDGRYVNQCNVSAFISNLPTAALNTSKFSSGEASGSTSQAANVAEAIEMGASAFLVDEDTRYVTVLSCRSAFGIMYLTEHSRFPRTKCGKFHGA